MIEDYNTYRPNLAAAPSLVQDSENFINQNVTGAMRYLPEQFHGNELLTFLTDCINNVLTETPEEPALVFRSDNMLLPTYTDAESVNAYYFKCVYPLIGTRYELDRLLELYSLPALITEWWQSTIEKPLYYAEIRFFENPHFQNVIKFFNLLKTYKNERTNIDRVYAPNTACCDVLIPSLQAYHELDWHTLSIPNGAIIEHTVFCFGNQYPNYVNMFEVFDLRIRIVLRRLRYGATEFADTSQGVSRLESTSSVVGSSRTWDNFIPTEQNLWIGQWDQWLYPQLIPNIAHSSPAALPTFGLPSSGWTTNPDLVFNAGTDIIALVNHKFINGQRLAFSVITGGPISGTSAYVISSEPVSGTFKLSYISNGPAITFLNNGRGTLASRSVTITNTGDLINLADHGLVVNSPVFFSSITGVSSSIVTNTVYYIASTSFGTNSFKISSVVGGPTITFTTDGTAIMDYQFYDYEG